MIIIVFTIIQRGRLRNTVPYISVYIYNFILVGYDEEQSPFISHSGNLSAGAIAGIVIAFIVVVIVVLLIIYNFVWRKNTSCTSVPYVGYENGK